MCRAVAWAAGNPRDFDRLCKVGVEESGAGDWSGRYGKRHKILGVFAGRPPAEERRRNRGEQGEGPRPLRQARRTYHVPYPHDQPGAYPCRNGHLRS